MFSSWKAPPLGWIKLNFDGAVSLDNQHAPIGGVLQDANVNWLWGYAIMFASSSIFKVKARTMLDGLILAWDKGFKKVEVECDNMLLVELLHSGRGANGKIVEVCLIHQMLQRGWEVCVRYVLRDANVVADAMAKITIGDDLQLQLFQKPSVAVNRFIQDDSFNASTVPI